MLTAQAGDSTLTMTTQRQQLEQLAQEIAATIPDPWLFPPGDRLQPGLPGRTVQGFLGTGPIMRVSERPSTGKFGGLADRLLYGVLEELGATNAHLTDVIKSRGKVGEPYPEDIAPHHRVFDREIEIIRPRRIIVFGQKVRDLLRFTLAGSGITIAQVWHYSYTRRGQNKAVGFERQLAEALAKP